MGVLIRGLFRNLATSVGGSDIYCTSINIYKQHEHPGWSFKTWIQSLAYFLKPLVPIICGLSVLLKVILCMLLYSPDPFIVETVHSLNPTAQLMHGPAHFPRQWRMIKSSDCVKQKRTEKAREWSCDESRKGKQAERRRFTYKYILKFGINTASVLSKNPPGSADWLIRMPDTMSRSTRC